MKNQLLLFTVSCALVFLSYNSPSRSAILTENVDNATMRMQIAQKLDSLPGQKNENSTESYLLGFEERMQNDGNSRQIRECYKLLLNAITSYECTQSYSGYKLCRDLVVELADPSQVNQGNHNTCALAAMETYLYEQDPSLLCRIVFQAESGKVETPGGKVAVIPDVDIPPDREASHFKSGLPYRSYASQIFQVAMANMYWQSQSKDPRGMSVPQGSISYVQNCGNNNVCPGDTRERLLIKWSPDITEYVYRDDCLPESSPGFTLARLKDAFKMLRLGGKIPCVLAHIKNHGAKTVDAFSDESDLRKHLLKLKKRREFPAIISVAMSSLSQFNASRSNRCLWHVMCINDYDDDAKAASVYNFWGNPGNAETERIGLHDLYTDSQLQTGIATAKLGKETTGHM